MNVNSETRFGDPEAYPSALDHLITSLIADGYSDDEVRDELPPSYVATLADRRLWGLRIAALRRATGNVEAVLEVRTAPQGGLTRERIIEAVIAIREPGGTWPTQTATAEELNLKDGRRIRQVQGLRGWPGILEDAAARAPDG